MNHTAMTPFFTLKAIEEKADYGRFEIEPLPQGFGQTVGNSMRRVLLTFLPGASVSSVKIKGVRHQFSTLKGMREDIAELILNLKQVYFRLEDEQTAELKLEKAGPIDIHASDITFPANVTIAKPDVYLGSLADKNAKLDMTIWIEQGTGYLPSEERQVSEIGVIPVDSLFSPVRRVNFTVEETRVGRATNFDKLILDVWTTGAVNPKEAVTSSAKILVSYFQHLYEPKEEPVQKSSVSLLPDTVLDASIDELELSVRVVNALKKGGFSVLRDFQGKNKKQLEKVRNLGDKSIITIEKLLKEKGIELAS